ncbi:hypothetical protein FAGAP_6017 [Fusarium agapanthi]|uniref:Zn(2)-C6 fungal-type domain-containing protein n=1 Tax=Fusarium agapanthi TaxID=1803897 RepID=A0A9P5E6P4_9HYPO|nr:hypothetical protein FAGAP_6017 [Fusarium agapanthi]
MTENCDFPNSILSDAFQELNPKAPPAPLDLLSTVSTVFYQRSERLQREALARTDAEIEAGFVATREARIKEKLEELEEVDEEWAGEEASEDEWDQDEYEDEIPSREDVEAFVNGVFDTEATGPILDRAIGETIEGHRKRMKALEDRIQGYQLSKFVLEDVRGDPPRYVEGFPVNLVKAFCRLRPLIPARNTGMFVCLQCQVKGKRCSRNMNYSPACERCRRHGDLCLVKDSKHPVAVCWRFPGGQETGDIEHVELEWWLERLANKGQVEGVPALPVWHEVGGNPSNNGGEEEMPQKWQDLLKGSAKRKISAQ